jgi:hypothetical protein
MDPNPNMTIDDDSDDSDDSDWIGAEEKLRKK